MVVRRKTTTRCCYCTARAHFDGTLAFLACEEVKLHLLECFRICLVAVLQRRSVTKSVTTWPLGHPECCCGGTAVPPALASSRVYQHRAETTPAQRNVISVGRMSSLRPQRKATSAGRVSTLRPQREVTSVGRFPLTLIDQLTNISNDPGSRSMIRSRSDFLSILALIDRTCWMDAHRGLHTQSLPVT